MAVGKGSIQALRAYFKRKVGDQFDTDIISREMENESDRACVILVGSILEDELLNRICLDCNIRNDLNADERNSLFGPDGVIGSFSRRISLAYAFRVIEKSTRDQLTIVREMRNACAHHMGPISFETPELFEVCKNLFHKDNAPLLPAYEGTDPKIMRVAFMSEGLCLAMVIRLGSRERARDQWSRQPQPLHDTPSPPPTTKGPRAPKA